LPGPGLEPVIDINRTTNFRSMGISACFSCFDQANRERLR